MVKEQEFAAIVLKRVSTFLLIERRANGCSIDILAKGIKVTREQIRQWEAGVSCPPCYLLVSTARYFGPLSYSRLANLIFELQMQKYERTKGSLGSQSEF